jgi:hypothetical protein
MMLYTATVKRFVFIPGHPVLQQQPAIQGARWEFVRKAMIPVRMMESFVMVVKAVMRRVRPVYPAGTPVKGKFLCVTKKTMCV